MRILIADDESIIRMGLASILETQGHSVLAAANGREAIRLAEHHQPDLAILDIRMPYTNGLQAAETIAKQRPLPILILTAFSEQDLIEKATDLPIHGYLIKPVQPEALDAAIRVAVKRFEERQAQAELTSKLARQLATRKLVDRAKGLLMESGLTEAEAYTELQARARDNRESIVVTAEKIVRQAGSPR